MKNSKNKILLLSTLFCLLLGIGYQNCGSVIDDNGVNEFSEEGTNDPSTNIVNPLCQSGSLKCYTLGGTISGLNSGGTITITMNPSIRPRTHNFIANGPFTFSEAILLGGNYDVTIVNQPTGQTCSVTNGKGRVVVAANVTNVLVTCGGWVPTSLTGAPAPKAQHHAVWTGSKMIVWGGGATNTGGIYDPITNSWTATNVVGAPQVSYDNAAFWTGSKMIVWSSGSKNTGGIYDPATNSWSPISTTGAPVARFNFSAVWTGSKMIVWGGYNDGGHIKHNDGGIYNPATNSWSPMSTAGAPSARHNNSAVWTGSKMIVWGGERQNGTTNDGGIYDPATNTWSALNLAGAPSARTGHKGLFVNSKMVILSGANGATTYNDGGIYNPTTNSWSSVSTNGAPSPRTLNTAVTDGTRIYVWGGYGHPDGSSYYSSYNDGAKYEVSSNTWSPIPVTTNTPSPRVVSSAVWTGTSMIVWGGMTLTTSSTALNNGGIYTP